MDEDRKYALYLAQEAERTAGCSGTDDIIERARRYLDFLLGRDGPVKASSEDAARGFGG